MEHRVPQGQGPLGRRIKLRDEPLAGTWNHGLALLTRKETAMRCSHAHQEGVTTVGNKQWHQGTLQLGSRNTREPETNRLTIQTVLLNPIPESPNP